MLNQNALGKAFAAAAAIFWVICSGLVYLMPQMMMNMTSHMVHANFQTLNWHIPLTGFVIGLLIWTIGSGLFGWLIGTFYNRFVKM